MINSPRLQHFKNFDDAMLPLGPLTVIVGTNASGKSNLRDAFRFVHGLSREYSLADIVGEKFVDGTLQWRGIRGGSREIVTFGQSSFGLETALPWQAKGQLIPQKYVHRIRVETGQGIRPLRVVQESLYRGNDLVYDSHPASDVPAQEGPQYLLVRLKQVGDQRRRGSTIRFLSDQAVLSQFPAHDDVPSELRPYAKRALNQLRSMRFLDLSPEAMKLPSVPGQPLGDRGENLSSALQATAAKDQADSLGKKIVSDLYDIFHRQREAAVQPVEKDDVAEVLRRRLGDGPGAVIGSMTRRCRRKRGSCPPIGVWAIGPT